MIVMQEKYLTVKEVARVLDYSIETVKRKLRNKEIPGGMKVGREWRINPSVFKEFLEERERQNRETH